jgi:hypothetical protein
MVISVALEWLQPAKREGKQSGNVKRMNEHAVRRLIEWLLERLEATGYRLRAYGMKQINSSSSLKP